MQFSDDDSKHTPGAPVEFPATPSFLCKAKETVTVSFFRLPVGYPKDTKYGSSIQGLFRCHVCPRFMKEQNHLAVVRPVELLEHH
jgi:hypothetical protein